MGGCAGKPTDPTAAAIVKGNLPLDKNGTEGKGTTGASAPMPTPAHSTGVKNNLTPKDKYAVNSTRPEKDFVIPIQTTPSAVQLMKSKLRTDCKVRDAYKLGKTLGTGGFAIVKLAVDKRTNEEFACKIMALPPPGQEPGENENTREDIFKEIDILCGLNHENVIWLKEYFEEGNKVYLITELLTGGELLDAVLQRGTYSEAEARLCFMQLLKGIEYLHSKNVVHRDLKLENLLLASPDDITRVKIADFGLAKKCADTMNTICGTPQYVAPEVIQGTPGLAYGPGVDMWSAGVVLFILLGGYPPFWSDSEPALFEQIRRGAFSFDDPVWDTVSENAKDLIRKLLIVEPKKRLSATQSLHHAWITGEASTVPLTSTQRNMRTRLRNKFKGAIGTIIAINRMEKLFKSASAESSPAADQLDRGGSHMRKAHAAAERYEKNRGPGPGNGLNIKAGAGKMAPEAVPVGRMVGGVAGGPRAGWEH